MKPKAKKRSTRICVGLFFLLGGIEYAVILPTLWLYLEHRFDSEQWFFGVVFAAFCFSNLLSSPLFGFWVDYTQKTKPAILFANLFEIGGNFLYFVAWSKYWVLGARLISGIGAGIGAGIFAQIARTTTEEERTGIYSIAMALRHFGLLVESPGNSGYRHPIIQSLPVHLCYSTVALILFGPGLNLFLRELNIKLGPFKIDTYTAPGIFMAIMWVLLEVFMLLFYFDLPVLHSVEHEDFSDYSINSQGGSSVGQKSASPHFENRSINGYVVERRSYSPYSQNVNGDLTDPNSCVDEERSELLNTTAGGFHERLKKPSVMNKWHLTKDLIREEVIVILASQFMMFFNETAFEALVTPLSEYLLGWKEIQNSILYCLIALQAILVFILVKKLSRKISDRWLMVIGVASEGLALIWYLFMLANAKPYESRVLPTLTVGTLLIVFGVPFFSVANISLYSKITDKKTQGIAQGIQRSVTGVAMIMGPLWGGALLHQLYVMLGVMAALEVILTLIIFLSFHRLKAPSKQMPTPYSEIIADNERQPLLA